MHGTFSYEKQLFFKRKNLIFLIVFVLIIVLILISLIPLSGDAHEALGYPRNISLEEMITSYKNELTEIYKNVEEAQYPIEYKMGRIKILNYFISSNTCEYDYITYNELIYLHNGSESMSLFMSLIEGISMVNVVISVLISNYFITYPLSKNYIRQMIESGEQRNKIFKVKNSLGLFILYAIITIISLIALIGLKPYYSNNVLMAYNNGFLSVPLIQMISSRIISLYIGATFYYFFSELLGVLFKKISISIFIPFALFITCFICCNISVPSWGNYGQLTGLSKYLITFTPFSNIVVAPAFGFELEVIGVLVTYTAICIILFLLNKSIFMKGQL